jgi:hypothetical protein
MAYLLREGNVTVLHCDSDKLRAVHGVSEFFVRPTVVSLWQDDELNYYPRLQLITRH